jgi:hypothetical protein
MGALQFQKALRLSLLRCQARNAVHDLLGTRESVGDAPADDEDLSGASPLPFKGRIEQGRGPDASFL